MTMTTITLNQSLDAAIARLPARQQRRYARYFNRRPNARQELLDEISDKLLADPECPACGVMPVLTGYNAGSVSGDSPFSIDLDNLEKFLQLIIKYLPTLIEMFMNLFAIMIAFVVFSLASSNSYAQCENGVCRLPVRAIGKVAQAAETVATAAAVAPARFVSSIVEPQRSMGAHLSQMNSSNTMFHSPAPVENVYYASNGATRFKARQAWRESPSHAKNLKRIVPLFGVKCRGNYCVARGR